ncbi:MAG: hypothetical protein KTR20_11080 [Cellvibrionaceae bacterium]|nr:hypothetical protein [Cellvibrionaceae bacterium]
MDYGMNVMAVEAYLSVLACERLSLKARLEVLSRLLHKKASGTCPVFGLLTRQNILAKFLAETRAKKFKHKASVAQTANGIVVAELKWEIEFPFVGSLKAVHRTKQSFHFKEGKIVFIQDRTSPGEVFGQSSKVSAALKVTAVASMLYWRARMLLKLI